MPPVESSGQSERRSSMRINTGKTSRMSSASSGKSPAVFFKGGPFAAAVAANELVGQLFDGVAVAAA